MHRSRSTQPFPVVFAIGCLILYIFINFPFSRSPTNNTTPTPPLVLTPVPTQIPTPNPIQDVMLGKITLNQDDPKLIEHILETGLLVPPSKLPYRLFEPHKYSGRGPGIVIRKLLPELGITKGFFVECGAYDGEYLSNTLYLEKEFGWKGLLVEGNPDSYSMLTYKNRKAWISKTCLSVHPKPHKARFTSKSLWTTLLLPGSNNAGRKVVEVQCVPLFTLLSAIKVDTVDFFSLDVEGSELEVLETIPFDKLFIKIIALENSRLPRHKELLELMENKGYIEVRKAKYAKDLPEDYVFVHEKVIRESKFVL